MPITDFDLDPIRPGAAPQLDVNAVGFPDQRSSQPIDLRMTEALTRVLRLHFSKQTYIEFPNLTDRVWIAGEKSPIVIASLAEWKPTESDKRPALLVDGLDQDRDMPHRVIGDQRQGLTPGYFIHLFTGQHVIHCTGGREGESSYLANEVYRELTRFAHVIREQLCLVRFLPYKKGKRTQLDIEGKEIYTIPVLCGYAYWESYRSHPVDETEITGIQTVLSGI